MLNSHPSIRACLYGLCVLVSVGLGTGCSSGPLSSDLSVLYDQAAQYHGVERTPIILIPGILGSKLVYAPSDTSVVVESLYDPFLWTRMEWGLADPD